MAVVLIKFLQWFLLRPQHRSLLWNAVVGVLALLTLDPAGRFMVLGRTVYTNQFAVLLKGGKTVADSVAQQYGFVNQGPIGPGALRDYYLFVHHDIQKRSVEFAHHHHFKLKQDPQVLWAEQQHAKIRVKRDEHLDYIKSRSQFSMPDPLYPEQWYLHGGARDGHDMNVVPAWALGYTGKNVVVTILDDGIQTNHPDLVQNYDPLASSDINDRDSDPTPQDNGDNKHGTRCAGEVAATAFNEFCGVGIAYNASIGGVRMLDGTVTDEVEAKAVSFNNQHVDIYSASWGPEDDGRTVDGPGRLAKQAFLDGIFRGRKGRGSIFVWASGNGGRFKDNCNCDGYTNSIYTLSISSATQAGAKPWYLEECSSTLATTYSSGTPGQDANVVTVDMDTSYFQRLKLNQPPDPFSLCTRSHTGTSASAPIGAAICALALEANPWLTWRDMQHLVVSTSRPEPLIADDGWTTNGVGRKVSHKFGYGLMDAVALVRLAERWASVPVQRVCETPAITEESIIPSEVGARLEASMMTDACFGRRNVVRYLEHVQVHISLQYMPRGALRIVLVSPSGTSSSVLLPRPRDIDEDTFNNWPFLSVHFWGEPAPGEWKLIIINEGSKDAIQPGKLKKWSLVFYGTSVYPVNLHPPPNNTADSRLVGQRGHHYRPPVRDTIQSGTLEGLEVVCHSPYFLHVETGECVPDCPEGQFGEAHHRECHQCHPSCRLCYGPLADHCLSCAGNTLLSGDSCVDVCNAGYFVDAALHECLPCLSHCHTCEKKPDNCTSCNAPLVLIGSQCLMSCPSHAYRSGASCSPCDVACTTCHGPSNSDCLSCASGYLHNGTCLASCPDGYFADNQECVRCPSSCMLCSSGEVCTACFPGLELHSSGKCIVKVFGAVCPMGSFRKHKDCVACHSSCMGCSGPRHDQCTSCLPDSFLHLGSCASECPAGFFSNHQRECGECHESCATCKQLNKCESCKSGLKLLQGMCIGICPDRWYNDRGVCVPCHNTCATCMGENENDCVTCPHGRILAAGACHTSCPQGYYAQSELECLHCHSSCYNCSGPGPLACTFCRDSAMLRGGACIPCLEREFLNATSQMCQQCHRSCLNCSGPMAFHCESCLPPFHLDPLQHLCVPCCDGETNHFQDHCCICSHSTGSCISPTGHIRSVGHKHHKPATDRVDSFGIPPSNIVPIILAICASAIVLYLIIFGVLQVMSSTSCRWPFHVRRYQRVPSNFAAHYDSSIEKVALTQDDADDEDELYTKT